MACVGNRGKLANLQLAAATACLGALSIVLASWYMYQPFPRSSIAQFQNGQMEETITNSMLFLKSQPQLLARFNLNARSKPVQKRGNQQLSARRKALKQHRYLTDAQLLRDASDATLEPVPLGPPRIAFLFLVRAEIPFEALWRRFFNEHQGLYSVYVHATPGFAFPPGSFFAGKEIPSRKLLRMSRSLVDAVRRLLAYSLLDPQVNNAWFVNVCETTIPLRSFPYVYNYLISSKVSFVESFYPVSRYYSWDTSPEFEMKDLRKGEVWMALERRHAALVVAESTIYLKFAAQCTWFCTPDEQYFQTMLHLKDGAGIANRTVMYVDWSEPHGSAPRTFDATTTSVTLLQDLQSRTRDTDGARHDTAADNTILSCLLNDVPNSPCFLFARKFHGDASSVLHSATPDILGY